MLKRLAILGIWFSLAVPAMAAQKQPASDEKTRQGQQSLTATIAANNHPTGLDQQCGDDKPHGWHKFIAWPEGVATWAVMFTLGAIIWQSYETRKAAEAANRGMETSKTKERAKLLLAIAPLRPVVGAIPEAKLRITNVGESSAIVGVAIAGLHISDSDTLEEHGPGYYGLTIDHALLKSGESSEEPVWWPQDPLWRYRNVADIEGENQLTIHLHGIINFRDAFEDWWRLKFHYIWRSYGMEIWVPSAQEKRTGEWEDQTNGDGETRMEKPSKKKWWEFWRKSTPIPKSRAN
jgi:hypothetical protein